MSYVWQHPRTETKLYHKKNKCCNWRYFWKPWLKWAYLHWWKKVFGHLVHVCYCAENQSSVSKCSLLYGHLPSCCTSSSHLDVSARWRPFATRPLYKSTRTARIYFSYFVLLPINNTIISICLCAPDAAKPFETHIEKNHSGGEWECHLKTFFHYIDLLSQKNNTYC